jgi:hypothetical protein
MERAAMVTAVLSCALCACLAWLGKEMPPAAERSPRVQFRLWQLFVVMNAAEILLGAIKWFERVSIPFFAS